MTRRDKTSGSGCRTADVCNGVVDGDETCDDGNIAAGNGYSASGGATCELTPYCGDAVVRAEDGEVCGDGVT